MTDLPQSSPATLAKLGTIMQISYVPDDYDAALDYWTQKMGAGPFFHTEGVDVENVKYRGQPSDIQFSMAIGYWGDVQVELIRPDNDAPSMFKDWREKGLQGVQHLCIIVDDLAEARQITESKGGIVIQEVSLPGGVGGAFYADYGGGPGTIIEYLQIPQAGRDGFAAMRQAHLDWDGKTNPVIGKD
ncbi:VOC family protein [Parasphingorhabdus sp. JC815]|uniref:VOC family protein n=1 Tax=Parasphingorhabdus sp. JC815 TaxID=3232140 RepID=UPI003459E970